MRFICADCGCTVDRGVVVTPCPDPECCCLHLPRAPAPEDYPQQDPPPGGAAGT